MQVIHILKDGSRLEDITGHIVKVADADTVYNMIRAINRKNQSLHNSDRESESAL